MTKYIDQSGHEFESPQSASRRVNSRQYLMEVMEKMSMSAIVHEMGVWEVRLSKDGNKLSRELHQVAEDNHLNFTNKKVDEYNKMKGITLDKMQVVGYVLAPALFGKVGFDGMQVAGGFVGRVHEYNTNQSHATHAGYDHGTHIATRSQDDTKRSMSGRDQQIQETKSQIDRIESLRNEVIRALFSGG